MSRTKGSIRIVLLSVALAASGLAACFVAMRKGKLGALGRACQRCGHARCRCGPGRQAEAKQTLTEPVKPLQG